MNRVKLIDGRYTPLNFLGGGGFGNVNLVTDTVTGQVHALKFLTKGGEDAAERFHREARLLTELRSNPYVVQIITHNLDHLPPYIVMEYCEGGSLRSWVTARPPWQDVAGALVHVLLGLTAIHEAGGFHRDLKPDNLLISRHPTEAGGLVIKVGDWGLARDPGTDLPMTRTGAGTPGYIAPEILAAGAFDARADIYSMGVVATELLTGTVDGSALGTTEMPERLRATVRQMLSLQPAMRPTAKTIAASLQQLLETPAVPLTVERPQQQEEGPGVGAFLLGGLLVGGALMALAALAGEDDTGSPPTGGVAPKA